MDYLKIILIIIAAVAAIVIIALIIAKSSEKNEYLQLKVNYGRLKKYEFTYEEYESISHFFKNTLKDGEPYICLLYTSPSPRDA